MKSRKENDREADSNKTLETKKDDPNPAVSTPNAETKHQEQTNKKNKTNKTNKTNKKNKTNKTNKNNGKKSSARGNFSPNSSVAPHLGNSAQEHRKTV